MQMISEKKTIMLPRRKSKMKEGGRRRKAEEGMKCRRWRKETENVIKSIKRIDKKKDAERKKEGRKEVLKEGKKRRGGRTSEGR